MTMPLAHYKCNDNAASTAVVDSIANYVGTATANTSTMTAAGKVSTSLAFNGSNFISMGHITQFDSTQHWSVAFWIYPTSLANYQVVFEIVSSSESVMPCQIWTYPTGQWELHAGNGSNYAITSNSTLAINAWRHYVVVFDGTLANASRLKIYENGSATPLTSVITGTISTTTGTGTYSHMGIRYLFSNYPLYARLDDVRVYNTSISTSEIAALYNGGSGTEVDDVMASGSAGAMSTMRGIWGA